MTGQLDCDGSDSCEGDAGRSEAAPYTAAPAVGPLTAAGRVMAVNAPTATDAVMATSIAAARGASRPTTVDRTSSVRPSCSSARLCRTTVKSAALRQASCRDLLRCCAQQGAPASWTCGPRRRGHARGARRRSTWRPARAPATLERDLGTAQQLVVHPVVDGRGGVPLVGRETGLLAHQVTAVDQPAPAPGQRPGDGRLAGAQQPADEHQTHRAPAQVLEREPEQTSCQASCSARSEPRCAARSTATIARIWAR
jgi:hypothetical protein